MISRRMLSAFPSHVLMAKNTAEKSTEERSFWYTAAAGGTLRLIDEEIASFQMSSEQKQYAARFSIFAWATRSESCSGARK